MTFQPDTAHEGDEHHVKQGESQRRPIRQIGMCLAVFAVYVLLAAVMTSPLVKHMATYVPGDGRDDPPLVWNLWWVRYALLELHTNPLVCNYMFFPIGVNLTYYTLTILNGLLSIPLQLAVGLVLSSNVNFLASYAVGAFGMYLLALDLLGRRRFQSRVPYLAAFVAGLVYAFAPIKMIFASLGQFNMTSTQWLPLCVLYILRATRPLSRVPEQDATAGLQGQAAAPRRRGGGVFGRLRGFVSGFFPAHDQDGRRSALMAAIFLLFTAYAEFTFASFLIIFLAVYLAYLLITRWSTTATRWMLGRFTIIGLVFVVGLWPILSSMLREIAVEGDYSLTAGWGFADVFSADLLGFFVPSQLHPLFGSLAKQLTAGFTYTNFAAIGIAVLLLAVIGVVANRRHHKSAPTPAFWGASALFFAVLSLGPVLHINGRWVFDLDGLVVRLPLPFIILHYIPFIKANRYPSRLQVMVVLCLSVLVAYGAAAILERTRTNTHATPIDMKQGDAAGSRRRRWRLNLHAVSPQTVVTVVLAAAILFENLAVPLPLSNLQVPQVYQHIAEDNGNAPVLDLPLSWRNSFQFIPQSFTMLPQTVNTVTMFEQYYQSTHQGPILSGNTSRNPEFKFTYFLEAPVVRSIVALEEGRSLSQEQIDYDRSMIPQVLRLFGFKYIIVHPPLVGGPVEDYVRTVFPVEPIPADDGLSAYRVIASKTSAPYTIDMGSDASNLYRAEGWGEPQVDLNLGDHRVFRWTDRKDARLLIPLDAAGPLTLGFSMYFPYHQSDVTITVNGHSVNIGPKTGGRLTPGWADFRLVIPRGATHAGVNDLVISVADLGLLPYPPTTPFSVGQTGVKTNTNIVASSAGLEAGGDAGFAHIYVNGSDAIVGRRGLNVAVIDPDTGNVTRTAVFDLLADPAYNARLLDFVKSVPAGQVVAIAVMDDASVNFGDGAAEALRLIGASADLRNHFRGSVAVIGAKGAAPGQAQQQMAQGRPVSVAVGAHVFGAGLGVAVSRVTVDPMIGATAQTTAEGAQSP